MERCSRSFSYLSEASCQHLTFPISTQTQSIGERHCLAGKKDFLLNRNPKSGRAPCYGKQIDDELTDVVCRYNKHGVPVGDSILRCNPITILTKEGRNDILNRIVPDNEDLTAADQLRFGKEWAKRFYRRHKLRSRLATTKMRDEVPADYERKKKNFYSK